MRTDDELARTMSAPPRSDLSTLLLSSLVPSSRMSTLPSALVTNASAPPPPPCNDRQPCPPWTALPSKEESMITTGKSMCADMCIAPPLA